MSEINRIVHTLISGELYKLRKYRLYISFLKDYKTRLNHIIYVFSVHRRGFTVSDWEILGLDKKKYRSYLTSKMYSGVHPINGYYSKIIDDKLNIKYVLSGTELDKYMPEYFYLIDEEGIISPMMDAPYIENSANSLSIIKLLKEREKLALKLITGSVGKGFYKLEYSHGNYFLNSDKMTEKEVQRFISGLRNYVVTEYLTPHPDIARIWPDTANTIRYLTGRVNNEWRMLKSFIRFGSRKTGNVENFNRGGVLCYIDPKGVFQGGYLLQKKGAHFRTTNISIHPDTKEELIGEIPCWNEVNNAVRGIEKLLPQTRYLGFDFVITDKNEVKLLEINSLTSLDSIQLDGSILNTENGKWFFKSLYKKGYPDIYQ